MANDVKIRVKDIGKFVGALRKVKDDVPGQMKEGFLKIAEIVADATRGKTPKRTGRAAASITARGKQRGAAIAVGGQKAPHYPWLDFGGSTGKGHIPGKGWSGAIKRTMPEGGRYLYPTIKDNSETIRHETDALLERVIKGAGFDTRK